MAPPQHLRLESSEHLIEDKTRTSSDDRNGHQLHNLTPQDPKSTPSSPPPWPFDDSKAPLAESLASSRTFTYPPPPPGNNEDGYSNAPRQRPSRHRVVRFWSWELAALFFAVSIMIAKISLLASYEDQELPDWPLSINLNTLIALLSILQRAALLLIMAEIVGQAKWLWFTERSRPLLHLHEFDEASRSVLGALRLMFVGGTAKARGGIKAVVLLAAGVTVLSFGIGPFSQQALHSKPCRRLVPSENATVPVGSYVPGTQSAFYRIGAGMWEVDSEMKGAMINGLTRPGGADTAITARCPTGDCTFPDHGTNFTYSSIGVCSKCVDAGSLVKGPNAAKNITLGDGTTLSTDRDMPWFAIQPSNLSYAQSLFSGELEAAASTALLNVSIMSFSRPPCTSAADTSHCRSDENAITFPNISDVVALSCTLYPCLKSYHGLVKEGVLQEKVVSEIPAPLNLLEAPGVGSGITSNHTAFQSPCIVDNGTWYTSGNITKVPHVPGREFVNITLDGKNTTAPEECVYKLYSVYGMAIQAFMRELLFGSCSWNARQAGFLHCGLQWWLQPLYNNEGATADTLSTHMDGLATAITNEFRRNGKGPYASVANGSLPAQALGVEFEMSVCTKFDWRWLLLPIFLITVSSLLLAWIVVSNKFQETRQPVWKSSVLPLLFYGLKDNNNDTKVSNPGGMSRDYQLANFSEIKKMSRQKEVQFCNGGEGLEPGFYSDDARRNANQR